MLKLINYRSRRGKIESIEKKLDIATKEKGKIILILFCMNSKIVGSFVFGLI